MVSGRNGSGKSSFAEAFELAVTGDSYRWRNKAKLWTSNWRNIHHGDPCRIRVDFAVEGAPPATIGVDWATDAGLDDRTVWTQVAGEKRQPGLARLGWGAATELYRPILSYDELGGLFEEGPSKLYDALAKLLGLDEIHDAEKRIAQRAKSMGAARKAANDAVKTLKLRCAESDDERAEVATKLLRSRTPDLDAVERLATGTADGQGRIALLRIVAGVDAPDTDAVTEAAAAFRTALARAADTTTEALALADRQSALIRAALGVYDLTGDTTCPVCGEGALDDAWKAHAIEESARVEELLQDVRARESAVRVGATRPAGAFDAVCATGIPSGTALASAAEYEKLIKQARELPAAASPSSPTSSSSPRWRSRRRSNS